MIQKDFIPFPTLETDRLTLRRLDENDVDDLFKILSDEEVAKYEYFFPLKTKEEAQKFILRYQQQIEEEIELTWGIELNSSNELVGVCCIGSFDEGARRAELGYDVAQAHWGKGYATEALRAVVDYGFQKMNLNRIEATITPGNDASVKVLEKLDFLQEGLVRERDLLKGELVDGIIMAILKRDYQSMRSGDLA